jgi:hypothetical protein
MTPKGSHKGMGKATARAIMPTSGTNQRRFLDQECIKGLISEQICGLIQIYNLCGVKDGRAWDIFSDIIFLDPVATFHFVELIGSTDITMPRTMM